MHKVNQLSGFGGGGEAVETLIDRTSGTTHGNEDSVNDVEVIFNGDTTETLAAGGGTAPYKVGADLVVGKTYVAAKVFSRFIVYGTTDDGFVNSTDPSVTLNAYGKNGGNATAADTLIGTTGAFTEANDESAGRTITVTDSTPYTSYAIVVNTSGSGQSTAIAEIVAYELL